MDSSVTNNNSDISWYMKTKYEYAHDWFMVSSPFSPVLLVVVYLAFILKFGPAWMEKRQPFKIKTPILIYNFFQVLLSAYTFHVGSHLLLKYGLFGADKCWFEANLTAQKEVMSAIHLYYVGKLSELTDTVFFVLRKKKNQITFLHWYHHVLMMLSTFIAIKYMPSYSIIFLGTINSLVHVVMYSYYGLSAYPQLEKYLWWKKYITSFQLIQFVMIIIHLITFTYASKCSTPYFLLYDVILNAFLLIYLFGTFYVKSYVKKDAQRDISKTNGKSENDIVKSVQGITRRHVAS